MIIIVGVIICLTAVLFLCSGCSYFGKVPEHDPFVKLYNIKPVSKKPLSSDNGKSLSLTFSAKNMPLSAFCRIVSDKTNVGIVFNSSLSNSLISGEFKDSNVGEVLNVISRQLNVECLRVGATYFLGKIRPEDRGVLVKKVRGFNPDELKTSISTLLSDVGKVEAFSSGIVVVSDREHILSKINTMCNYIEAGFSGSWIVQLYFVIVRKGAMANAGFDTTSSGKFSYDISNSTLNVEDIRLDGLFKVVSQSSFADMYASPMLLMRDGVSGTWKDGERIPIPKKSVSNYGVVTTEDFEYIDTGLNITCTVRESSSGAVLNLNVSISDVIRYVEYSPVTSQCVFNSEFELKQNKVYLIGEMSRYKILNTQNNILNFGTDRGKSVIQVWGSVYRIGDVCKGKILKPDLKK